MKEKENQGPENLTPKELKPTLNSGDIFMAENGEGSNPSEDQIKAKTSVSETIKERITPAVEDIRDDVRKIREGKETDEQKKALANFKRKAKSAWSRKYDMSRLPHELRASVRAFGDAGIMPDRMSEENIKLFDPFLKTKEAPRVPTSQAGEVREKAKDTTMETADVVQEESNSELKIPAVESATEYLAKGRAGLEKALQEGWITEEQELELRQRMEIEAHERGNPESRRGRTLKEIDQLLAKINEATDFDSVKLEVDRILRFARLTEVDDKNDVIKNRNDEIENLIHTGDLDALKQLLISAAPEVKKYFSSVERVVPDTPRSIEDLAALIMRTSSEEWRTGGEKELIDKEGRINKQHFLAWFRKRMLDIHDFNPSSEVNFFSEINVRATWRDINFADMYFTGSYFLERRVERVPIGLDAEGNPIFETKETFHRNEDLEELKEELLYEIFLFQYSRNFHVNYFGVMGLESELPKTLAKIYGSNMFTRSNHLERVFTLPSISKKATNQKEEQGREVQEMLDKNGILGEATRRLLLSYKYIYDYRMLSRILGENAVLFKKEYKYMDSYTGKPKEGKDPKTSKGRTPGGDPYQTEDWFDENNKLKVNDNILMDEYMEYINIFTGPGPNKDASIIAEVRERMAQSIMDSMGLSYEEAKYAEAWAFSMTRWTGIAAAADTDGVGHDAWTKALNTFEYRLRQLQEHRNATFGNIFNLLGIKRIGLNLWDGIRDTQGRTIIEAIQGGEGSDYIPDLDLKGRSKNGEGLTFNEQAMGLFYANHIHNSFAFLEFLMDYGKFNFQELISIDSNGRRHIDYEKANKMIDGIQKAIRYLYSTWGGTDYSKTVHTWEKEDEDGTIEVKPKDLPILANLFGNEIIGMIYEEEKVAQDLRAKKEETLMKKLSPEQKERYMERRGRKREIDATRFERTALGKLTDDEKGRYSKMTDKQKAEFRKNYQEGQSQKMWNVEGLGEIDISKIQEHAVRQFLWKGVMKYLVKAEIEAHRNPYSDQRKFDYDEMERIYTYIKEKGLFTENEIKELRQLTHTTVGRLFMEEGSSSFFAGLAEALKKLRASLGIVTKA